MSATTHWHIYRLRWRKSTLQGRTATIDVGMVFDMARFPGTIEACGAIAEAIAGQFPEATRLPIFEQVRTVLPDHPEHSVTYTGARDGPVTWGLTECTGQCHHTRDETTKKYRRLLIEKTKHPFAE